MTRSKIFIIVLMIASGASIQGQSITLGSPVVENYLRRQQLLGRFDSTLSFNYRPLVFSKNGLKADSSVFDVDEYFGPTFKSKNGKSFFRLLPAELRIGYDLRHPDSRNDGAMIRSRGLQTYLSAGFYAESGILSIQFKPEFVWAQNRDYLGFPPPSLHFETTWQTRYLWFNTIDQPERYGLDSYSVFTWGQTSIRLNKWGLSLGLSTENIWWGPAIRNSIMMSNNAEGFPHLTLNTQRPIKTAVGSIEGQLITARLEGSGYNPPLDQTPFRGQIAFVPRPDDWRYFQGLSFSYSPKWIKGLSLGFTRWVQQYSETASATNDYFPVFSNFFRKNDNNVTRSEIERDQAAGLFGRWLWTDTNAELYFEFAKNDASVNLRDLLVDTDHSRALTVGINKLFSTDKADEFWQFNFEWTQTSQTESRLLRNASSWYIHSRVRHGFTHNGEILGSALGPGGNAQYLEVSWLKGFSRIGGALERYVHNNDFAVAAFPDDFTRYWVDYNIHGFWELRYNNMFISASLFFTNSLNYQWQVRMDPNDPTRFPDTPGVDRTNWNLDIKVSYTF